MKNLIICTSRVLFFCTIGIVFFMFVFVSCKKKDSLAEEVSSVPIVEGLEIVKAPLVTKIYASGVVQGIDEVPIVSKTEGVITKVNFNNGDKVKKNSFLMQVESNIVYQAFKSAQIDLENAYRNLNTSKELFNQGAISKVELEQARSNYYGALANKDVAKKRYNNTTIKSPIDGFVVDKNRSISVGSVVSQGMLLGRISNRQALKVVVAIADRFLPWISVGDEVQVNIAFKNEKTFNAKIQSISAGVDVETGSVQVEVVWTSNEKDQQVLRTGSVAQVIVDVAKGRSIKKETKEQGDVQHPVVPKSAINIEDNKSVLYIAVKNAEQEFYTVKKQLIEIGREFVGNAEVIKGLEDFFSNKTKFSPVVIISSLENLEDGQLVLVDVIGESNTF